MISLDFFFFFRYKLIFRRYATTGELFDEAVALLKKHNDIPNNFEYRQRALDNLRLIIQLNPKMIEGYIVLSKELLYGEINDDIRQHQRIKSVDHANRYSIRNRQSKGLMQQLDNSTPDLIECRETIRKGLSIDSTNASLLKLQSELDLILKYGRNNVQTRMMNIGSFGWSGTS